MESETDERIRRVVVFPEEGPLTGFAAELWRETRLTSMDAKGSMSAALSGGLSPVAFYRTLARDREPMSWKEVHLFLVDERFVSPLDKESNFRMIQETVLREIPVPRENVHEVKIGPWGAEEGAKRYEEELKVFFGLRNGEFPRFDMVVLGMGEDGHTASLFPGSPAIAETERIAVATLGTKAPNLRITLTLPVINRAARVIFIVTGSHKAEVLKRALSGKDRSIPASLVDLEEGSLFFLADRAAARLLPHRMDGIVIEET